MPRGDLFPEIGPFETGYLPLSTNHVMYLDSVAIRVAGRCCSAWWSGAGAGAVHRRFFDPEFWRVIIFDQRGAGRSRPSAAWRRQHHQDLVGDIETLRRHLALDRWLLFGGSWGSTWRSLCPGVPGRVIGCVLRGVFLGRPAEVDWFLQGRPRFSPMRMPASLVSA